MSTGTSLGNELRDFYAQESARIKDEFLASGNGRAAVQARTALVESIAVRLWKTFVSSDDDGPHDLALVAVGGFGRKWLFPQSDVDILFLHSADKSEREYKDVIRKFSQEIWDLRLRLSPTTRKLSECEKFDADNPEFTISLLDLRFLAGDRALYSRLYNSIPNLVAKQVKPLVQRLAEITRVRHAKFGDTVFHLEPNLKDAPGGLRDYNVAHWLSLISAMELQRDWPKDENQLPVTIRKQFEAALEFLMSVRCFLHFRHNRDDNTLTWEAQNDAASQKVGARASVGELSAADWMRIYFGNARAISRVCVKLLEESPSARPSLFGQFQHLQARLSNPEFSVVDGMIFVQQPDALRDPDALLRMFRFQARHGLTLSSTTEVQIERALPELAANPPEGVEAWHTLQEILVAPHAADALRAMHSLHVLTLFLPELAGIDSLVVRDYSHRYTVDEHTFVAIENLHKLRQSQSKWDQRYAELLEELEQPDLLYLALLLHDTGKAAKTDDHVKASAEIAETCIARLDLDELDRDTVLFLVGKHLEMSATLRRDIFDPEVVQQFGERVETPERLKMLCLMTYADIKAVNPEALTPWKAENIWQLYIGTANYMIRSVDERLHVAADDETLAHLRTLAPAAGKKLATFLEGLPRRYLRTHSVEDVLAHVGMAGELGKDNVQIGLKRGRHWFDLALVTVDRPSLFASVAGVLASWGMNIVKAAAYSNQNGIVVDTFNFTDRFRTLELNLPEWERFKQSLHDVLTGKADLAKMLRERLRSQKIPPPKVIVPTQIAFDDTCSEHSTLIEVLAQDQPGLLHRISAKLSQENCNIEIALIETEGQMAIDVFYLTSGGAKLTPEHQNRLRDALIEELSATSPV
jgi:[protein-PII] uridylyltransferase